jgi:hypothetical protein
MTASVMQSKRMEIIENKRRALRAGRTSDAVKRAPAGETDTAC